MTVEGGRRAGLPPPNRYPWRSEEDELATRTAWRQAFWCAFYGAGIIGCLVVYGLLQERIMSQPFGSGAGEMFRISAFLVFCNRSVAVLYALFMIGVKRESFRNEAPVWKYCAVSLSNVAASWCQYEALLYVSFPVQMLGKSFKMLPVMLWGLAISSKRYTLSDWAVAACVTGGVTEFLLTGNISAKHSNGTSVFGLVLLLIFLGCDGFTSTFQEKLFKEHKTTKYNQMLYVNFCSAVVSLLTLVVMGDLVEAFAFCGRHVTLLVDALLLSVAAVGGQWFIYSQVKEYGALVFAATMNVRQVVSIIVSYIQYHHAIAGLQILGLAIVFTALFFKSFQGFMSEKDPEKGTASAAKAKETLKMDPGESVNNVEEGYGAVSNKKLGF